MLKNFDPESYLEANEDVKKAVDEGVFKDALEHLEKYGLNEIKRGERRFHKDFEPYNEDEYLKLNSDVKEAVGKGVFKDGFEHFLKYGYEEIISNRRPWKKIVEPISEKKEFKIDNFDKEAFLRANEDILHAIEKGVINSLDEFLEKEGFEEIKKGIRKFHPDFEVFDEELYKYLFADVREAVENGAFENGFEHFAKYGYYEVLQGVRSWSEFSSLDEYLEYQFLKNRGFDVDYYKENNKDINFENEDKYLLHYIKYGKKEKRKAKFKFGPILHNPFVSVIAINYNGQNDLPDFLESIKNQSYKNFELIIVDNNSSDESEKIIKEFIKTSDINVKFLQTGENLGFAAGNNYALPYCKGELLALINVDTKTDKEWLKELIDAMSVDGDCAAVASKTLFYKKFQDIYFEGNEDFILDLEPLIHSLEYNKYFVRIGEVKNNKVFSVNKQIKISLPIQDKKLAFKLFSNNANANLYYKIGKNQKKEINVNEIVDISFSQKDVINSSYIINNAGSYTKDGMPADRGFGEYDEGQYDNKCYLDFFCGVSVLLRRSAILNRKIFVSEFFAYYEDSELSRWLRENGYKILYAPRSVVYHKHSATSSEGSDLWNLLVNRARLIYSYKPGDDPQKLFYEISQIEEEYKDVVPAELYAKLKKLSEKLLFRLKEKKEIVEYLKPIGIYNSFWNTKGGGESHALSIAQVLQEFDTVYLISETDFDIKELEKYYHMDLSKCVKIVEPFINPEFTKKFHIFINSTYRSNLQSYAKHSFYIVSFPHKDINKKILNDYVFLYNSDYTKRWAHIYWGEGLKEKVLYPLGMLDIDKVNINEIKKEKVILSVGRFFVGGHSKNQHIIASAYIQALKEHPELKDWKLVLIGSLNIHSQEDIEYFEKIKDMLKGYNALLLTNVERDVLEEYYKKAFIYVHASGSEVDYNKYPDRMEHFGITPVEAMLYGDYPVVYHYGGPAELLNKLQIGETFSNVSELKNILIKNMNIKNLDIYKNKVFEKIKKFVKEHNIKNEIRNLVKDIL